MKRAAAIVTNRGGRTCHAAIIARELGIPAVVGTGDATRDAGRRRSRSPSPAPRATPASSTPAQLDFAVEETELATMPEIRVKIMMNVGTPDQAFAFSRLPERRRRAGPAGVHHQPADRHPPQGAAGARRARRAAARRRSSETDRRLPRPAGLLRDSGSPRASRMIAAAFAPAPGDRADERLQVQRVRQPGRRRAATSRTRRTRCSATAAPRATCPPDFADCFAMECEALRYVRDEMGLTNVKIMIPFVRTLAEAEGVIDLLGRARAAPRRERPAGGDDVRAAVQRGARRPVPRPLRRLLHRLQRHDPADPGPGPRLRPGRRRLRRARPGGASSCSARRSRPARHAASTSASAARAPATTPTSPSGSWSEGIESMSLNPDTVVDTWLALARTA